jgi:hypothetical protein
MRTFARTVQADGGVSIDHREYYVGRALAGQRVACVMQAASQQFDIWSGASRIKQLPIKGLHGGPALPFEGYVTGISQEASPWNTLSPSLVIPCRLAISKEEC